MRKTLEYRKSDRARARAEVEEVEVPVPEARAQVRDQELGPPLGLGTGDEGTRVEREPEAEEGLPADDVGERLAGGQARDVRRHIRIRVVTVLILPERADVLRIRKGIH